MLACGHSCSRSAVRRQLDKGTIMECKVCFSRHQVESVNDLPVNHGMVEVIGILHRERRVLYETQVCTLLNPSRYYQCL